MANGSHGFARSRAQEDEPRIGLMTDQLGGGRQECGVVLASLERRGHDDHRFVHGEPQSMLGVGDSIRRSVRLSCTVDAGGNDVDSTPLDPLLPHQPTGGGMCVGDEPSRPPVGRAQRAHQRRGQIMPQVIDQSQTEGNARSTRCIQSQETREYSTDTDGVGAQFTQESRHGQSTQRMPSPK